MKELILFSIYPNFLLFNYIVEGMILKRNKFLIQWRKFEIKRSYIFKVINF